MPKQLAALVDDAPAAMAILHRVPKDWLGIHVGVRALPFATNVGVGRFVGPSRTMLTNAQRRTLEILT